MPLAFFCTLFFRHRKKSVSAPWDDQSQSAPESARQSPPGAGVCACGRTGGFPLAPSPLRIATRSDRAPHRAASPSPAPESARHSPPRVISSAKLLLVAASRGAFRSPPCTPFGSPPKAIAHPIRLQALLPRRSRRVMPRRGRGMRLRAHQRAFLGANNRRGPPLYAYSPANTGASPCKPLPFKEASP